MGNLDSKHIVDNNNCDNLAKKFGFYLHSYSSNGGANRMYINQENGVCLKVNTINNDFSLSYNIDHTIFSVESGNLSPFYEIEPEYYQFEKMYNRFVEIVRKLKD